MHRWPPVLFIILSYLCLVAAWAQEPRWMNRPRPGPDFAVISGSVTNETGQPVSDATVHLERDRIAVARTRTDESGNYTLRVQPSRGAYDLLVRKADRGDVRLGIRLRPGQTLELAHILEEIVAIEGTLFMLDGKTPHAGIPVQAVPDFRGLSVKPVATALSNENGKYKLVNLRPGSYHVRCQVPQGYIYYSQKRNGASDRLSATPLMVGPRDTHKNIDIYFAPFKKGLWKSFDTLDGLGANAVTAIYRDPDGTMWFGTEGGGVSRYDGGEFINFTTQDGLAGSWIAAIYCDPDGIMWFGTEGGVSRYDGKKFTSFSLKDELPGDSVRSIYRDPDGKMWFGTSNGVSRYDGSQFVLFTTKDGLADDNVNVIHRGPDGRMWFGTMDGLSCYDGQKFVNFTKEDGLAGNSVNAIYSSPDGVIWFGTRSGVSRFDGTKFDNFTTKDGLAGNNVGVIYGDPDGTLWFGTAGWDSGGVSRYNDKAGDRIFVNFTAKDGLANNVVNAIYRDPDGVMWFGTGATDVYERGGISRYDDRNLINFTTVDGLAHDHVWVVHCCSDSEVIWFGTLGGGVSRYDGTSFTSFSTKDGLAHSQVTAIHRDPDGTMWFGTNAGGVSRYDGSKFTNFTTKEGLVSNSVRSIYRDSKGVMWFGTVGGVSRYDGNEFISFTTDHGLADNFVFAINGTPDGHIWFGTRGGVSMYDGAKFANLTTESGLPDNRVTAIYSDADGVLWFATHGGGVSRYDGRSFTNFSTQDGLAHNLVFAIFRDSSGDMWFGTDGGGVSRYNGIAWTSLDTRDGLAGNSVASIHQDSYGNLWFATDEGVTRYLRRTVPPRVGISSIYADQAYHDLSAVPSFRPNTRVTIKYGSTDYKTTPEKRQYQYRIKEMDPNWQSPTKATSFDYTFKKPGKYTFEVRAIDRDLNYSDPAASVYIRISSYPFYRTGTFIVLLSVIGGLSLCGLFALGAQRWYSSRTERLRLQSELEDARRMQLRLLPEKAPTVKGYDIAGVSQPAREVGGDFFDYLPLRDGKFGIVIADASDKGLKGAMNAVLTNGMLNRAAKDEASCGEILSSLNADLYPRIEKQMFTAIGLAILDQASGTMSWANAAQPYPMIKKGRQVSEFGEYGELPLGMIPDLSYSNWEMELQPGDLVVFYTDGITEAGNKEEEMYSTERLKTALTLMGLKMDAAAVAKAILQDVTRFMADAEQYDDMTVVVVKKV